jgi:glycosyltransferase involved in cell wall biosynthesis
MLPHDVILVGDASPDGGEILNTLHDLAYKYGDIFAVVVISLKQNSGPGSARNRGWEAAPQPWLAFLNVDDAWHPRKLEIQWVWLESHPDVVLCGHASQLSTGAIEFPGGGCARRHSAFADANAGFESLAHAIGHVA